MGWMVGQGLRSGANDFFYVRRSGARFSSALLPGQALVLPQDALHPAVFRQSELHGKAVVSVADAVVYVVTLARYVHPADASRDDPRRIMTGDLLRLVDSATAKTYVRAGSARPLPALSAVMPNAREKGPCGRPTFWYHLPPFTDRHRPALFVARVNGHDVRPFVNLGRELVVDANFSTLWPFRPDAAPAEAVFALLASSWAAAWLETACTVMGGGALKVEAADLKRMSFPKVATAASGELADIGAALMDDYSTHLMRCLEIAGALGYSDYENTLRAVVDERRSTRCRGRKW
ncbi:hypothetical protein ABQE48_22665 [Mycolicibacterium thermoresistibile]